MRRHGKRASYYRSEAARVGALADATPAQDGRDGFAAAARQYRDLADAFDSLDVAEEPVALGAAVARPRKAAGS